MLIQRAAMPHSVFRSVLPMLALGAGGIPEPNFDRNASPWTCFTDAGTGGDGGDGGAGGGGSGEGGAGAGGKPDKTFTQAELNALIAKERRAAEERLGKQFAEERTKTQAELDELRTKFEEHGKSAAEKERLAEQRARAAAETKLAEQAKLLAERDSLLARHQQELRDTRLGHELDGLLAAKKVLPEAMRAARLVFLADAKIEYDAENQVVGVDVGPKRFASVAEAVDDWMRANGAIYVAAPAGGAGTKLGNGSQTKPLTELSDDELIQQANQRRTASR